MKSFTGNFNFIVLSTFGTDILPLIFNHFLQIILLIFFNFIHFVRNPTFTVKVSPFFDEFMYDELWFKSHEKFNWNIQMAVCWKDLIRINQSNCARNWRMLIATFLNQLLEGLSLKSFTKWNFKFFLYIIP